MRRRRSGCAVASAENLKRKALDARALEEVWGRIPSSDRPTGASRAAARSFAALGDCGRAHRIIEQPGRKLGCW
jgi:hypothetical protein